MVDWVMPSTCKPSDISSFWNTPLAHWQTLCLLGLLIAIFLISIVYMLGSFLRRHELVAWCKGEFLQLFITAVIFTGIVGFLQFSCTYITPQSLGLAASVPGAPTDMFSAADFYLKWLAELALKHWARLATVNWVVSFEANTGLGSSAGGVGLDFTPFAGLAPITQALSLMMTATYTALIGILVVRMMLGLSALMMFNVYLPLGVFFRCFEPTRTFGGALIALAIGFFLFLPFLIILDSYVIKENLYINDESVGGNGLVQQEQNYNYAGNGLTDPHATTPGQFITDAGTMSSTLPKLDPSQMKQATGIDLNNPSAPPDPTHTVSRAGILISLSKVFLVILIAAIALPAINFILLISFIKGISAMLGEEMDVSNLTRAI